MDGEVIATLSPEAIERLHLAIGTSVLGLEQQIATEMSQLRVYDRALAMLAFRARSSVELSRLLVRKAESKDEVHYAIERLQEQGLLDDAAFARSFARAKVLGARHSRRRVQQDLARKGVARDVSETAIDAVLLEEEVNQEQVVLEAARRKLRSLANLDPAVRRRRLYGFLARRGYDGDDIRQAMSDVGESLKSGHEQED